MAVRHAMLVIARTVYDAVEIPGQDPLIVARGSGDEAAREWWEQNVRVVAAQIFQQSNASWERNLADWQAGTEIDVGKERLHDGGPRVDVARIRFPDGSERVVAPEAAKDYVAETFREEHPPPTVAAQYTDWRETIHIAELWTWLGWFFNGTENVPVDLGLPASRFGYPISEVLGCLNRLAVDGWQIVHVSEDRGPHPDGELAGESLLSVVRYLLSRPELSPR